jgi:GTP:adenosylcobinamide-phosphate guanylyltransferase
MAVNVILLAGAANTGPLREVSPATNEALVEINGKPMVQYVLDGLAQSREVGRIIVVSPPGELEPHVTGRNLEFVASRDHIVDNILEALKVLPQDEEFLVVSCDVPLITGEIIDDLIALCRRTPAELYYPIVEKSVAEARFPHVKRTYVTLREGTFTGGNIFLCHPRVAHRAAPKVREFLNYRKDPLKMIRLLGWSFALRYLFLKNLTLKELEQKVSDMLDLKGAVVVAPWPEVGVDVDKPSDLELVRSILK